MLKFEQLVLDKVIFEVRFGSGYLYWDNCGKIWLDLSERWPNLTFAQVNTQQAQLTLPDQTIGMTFSHERMGIDQSEPEDLDTFRDVSVYFTETVLKHLNVKMLTRLGTRFQYVLPLKEKEDTVDFLKSTGFLSIPGKAKELGEKIREAEVKFVVEREDISVTVRLGLLGRNLKVTVPRSVKVDQTQFIKRGLLVDLDCFSTKPFETSLLDVKQFITSQEKNVKRLTEIIFRED